MSASSRHALERCYDIEGIELLVRSEAPRVIEAIERRLDSFQPGLSQTPDLRMEFLLRRDGRRSRVPPPPPGRPVYETAGGELLYHAAADALYADLQGVRMRCQAGEGVARIESREYSGRRLYLATHALATVCLIELLKRRGRFNLHAACLAADGRGVLIAGPSGAGKSTLAIGLMRAGLSFLSDDMVFIDHAPGRVQLLAFPDALGITEQTAERFPELRSLLAAPLPDGFPKHLVRMRSVFAAPQVGRCTPHVLIFPELTGGGPSRLLALDPKDAWLRLVPDVLLTQLAAAQAHLQALAALLAQVRCHVLHAGPNVAQSVELILGAARR